MTTDAVPAAGSGVSDGQQAFLATGDGWALLIRWRDTDGAVVGTLDQAGLRAADVTGSQVAVVGSEHDGDVALQVGGGTWTGTVHGATLTLHIPAADGSLSTLQLGPGDVASYNAAVAALHAHASADAAASRAAQAAAAADAAVADADRRVGAVLGDLAQLTAALPGDADFSSDLADARADLATARRDFQTVADDAANPSETCSDGTLESDANTVETDANAVDTDATGVETTATGVEDDLAQLARDQRDLAGDFAALTAALAVSPASAGSHTRGEVDAATAAAGKAARAARAAQTAAKAAVADLAEQAHALTDRATQLAGTCP